MERIVGASSFAGSRFIWSKTATDFPEGRFRLMSESPAIHPEPV